MLHFDLTINHKTIPFVDEITYWLTPFVPLLLGLPPKITLALAVAVAVAVALTLKVSESPLIGPVGQPLSLWSCLDVLTCTSKNTHNILLIVYCRKISHCKLYICIMHNAQYDIYSM